MRTVNLTDGEAYDAASIIRAYARRIRSDLQLGGDNQPKPIQQALVQAAEQREKLADKLDGGE